MSWSVFQSKLLATSACFSCFPKILSTDNEKETAKDDLRHNDDDVILIQATTTAATT